MSKVWERMALFGVGMIFLFVNACEHTGSKIDKQLQSVSETSKNQTNYVGNLRLYGMPASAIFKKTTAYDFSLWGAGGKIIDLSNFDNKIVLLYFGYTHCPDICPTVMHTLAKVYQELGPLSSKVQVVMITIDPERDTPDIIQKYVAFFNPNFIGLSGSKSMIAYVAKKYKIFYQKEPNPKNPHAYYMNHSDFIYLIKNGKIKLVYTQPRQKPKWIVHDIKVLLGDV